MKLFAYNSVQLWENSKNCKSFKNLFCAQISQLFHSSSQFIFADYVQVYYEVIQNIIWTMYEFDFGLVCTTLLWWYNHICSNN